MTLPLFESGSTETVWFRRMYTNLYWRKTRHTAANTCRTQTVIKNTNLQCGSHLKILSDDNLATKVHFSYLEDVVNN